MKKIFPLFFSLTFTGLLVFILSVPVGPLPPAGAFFNPLEGFWTHAETRPPAETEQLQFDAINEPVEVFVSERGVPHIFAQNNEDLYFAQGYITARDRLFQMEVQVRAAAGRLSEWLGPDLLEYDRYQRRLGLLHGARQALEYMRKDSVTASLLDSYAAGVNAYIRSLRPREFPLEYKILNAEPQTWEPLHTALLLKYMTQTLASRASDVQTSNALAWFGEDFVDDYLSRRPKRQDPMVPPETPWEFDPVPVQDPPEIYRPSFTEQIQQFTTATGTGSNNWAVHGSKTAGGYPILANDPHLNMSMPSIWYEMQLHAPGINVYGVTLQGSPNVIIGFNEHAAWGTTNTGSDVMDWYEIEFRDDSFSHYFYDGEWVPAEAREEVIRVKGREAVRDTVYYTHHGPVVHTGEAAPFNSTVQKNHALRWIAHEPSNELLSYYLLNRAENTGDFEEAMSHFTAPAQNKVFADRQGDIALWLAGKFPLKWDRQGRTVSDGSDPGFDWQGFIPFEHNPHVINPPRGFVSTANQFPVSESYPYYLGDDFAPYERGLRINEQLREMDSITVEEMRRLQLDTYSYHAARLLPVFLDAIATTGADLTESRSRALGYLEDWNCMNDGELIAPSLFRYWWLELEDAIWNDEYNTDFPMRLPARDRTAEMIMDEPGAPWYDNIETEEQETRNDLIRQSFHAAFERLEEEFGPPGDNWKWGIVNNTNLNHIAQIPGLGVQNVFTGGGTESVNAIRGGHGPSWRMIVELKPDGVEGYGVYPGGQSGNPGSPLYDNLVEPWRTGEQFKLNFLTDRPEPGEFPRVLYFR